MDYEDDPEYLLCDPDNWKEHFPWDKGYVPYVYTLDQYENVKAKLLTLLALSGVDEYEGKRAQYLLRAIERDRRNMKTGPGTEPGSNVSHSRRY